MARIESVESTCAIKEALKGHQRSSVVIRGHQWSSVIIRGHQQGSDPYGGDAKTTGHERREGGLAGARGATKEEDDAPAVISGHQWSSEVISSHQWKCVIIRGSPAVINGHQWSSEVIVVINGHQRSSTVLNAPSLLLDVARDAKVQQRLGIRIVLAQ